MPVKYRVQSRVQGRFTSVSSTCITNINYDPEADTMSITFHNPTIGTWRYYNVDSFTAQSIITASSRGEYFNAYVRGLFPYDRIG